MLEKTDVEVATTLFVVEYSVAQKTIEVRQLSEVIKMNLQAIKGGRLPHFVPIAVFATQAQALEFSHRVRGQSPELFAEADDTEGDGFPQGRIIIHSGDTRTAYL